MGFLSAHLQLWCDRAFWFLRWGCAGFTYGRAPMVQTLVSLGTPHLSLEQYPFGRIPVNLPRVLATRPFGTSTLPSILLTPHHLLCLGGLQERWNAELGALETRGSSLRFCNYHYPSGESIPGVRIVCVAGEVMTSPSGFQGSWVYIVQSLWIFPGSQLGC
jgi:hypothetical protein